MEMGSCGFFIASVAAYKVQKQQGLLMAAIWLFPWLHKWLLLFPWATIFKKFNLRILYQYSIITIGVVGSLNALKKKFGIQRTSYTYC